MSSSMNAFPKAFEKKKVVTEPGNPLPIPLEGFGNIAATPWPIYSAVFDNGDIFVTDPAHIKALFINGFFGQEAMSRKGLDYELYSKKITQSQYSRRDQWRLDEQSLNEKPNDITEVKTSSRCERQSEETANTWCRVRGPASGRTSTPYHRTIKLNRSLTQGASTTDGVSKKLSSVGYRTCTKQVYVVEQCTDVGQDQCSLRNDPYPIEGSLHLMPEEAIFLCYGLGCLVVTDENGTQLNVDALWSRLVADDPELPYRYAAYDHLRCLKWIVRSGLRHGADYVLYPVGPPFYHSQYIVKVEAYDAVTRAPLIANPITDSCELNGNDRTASAVQKMCCLCVVLRPPALTDLSNVEHCLSMLRVELLPFSRMILGKVSCGSQDSDSDEERPV